MRRQHPGLLKKRLPMASSLHQMKSTIFPAAAIHMIAANPADKVTLPRKKKFYGQSYSVEEVQQLLSVLNDDPIRPAVILAVMYGLRRSEAVGLRWKDIDFKNKTMTICNTVTRMATVHELEDTKNESSHRTLPLIPGTEEYLQSLRREQKETMLLCGNRFDDS